MVSEILANSGLCDGLLLDGTKPLPEPVFTYDQWRPVTVTFEQFLHFCFYMFTTQLSAINYYNKLENYHSNLPGDTALMWTIPLATYTFIC